MAKKDQAAAESQENWDAGEDPVQAEPTVRVKCIVHTRPHTGGTEHHPEKHPRAHHGFEHGEERDLPVSVAEPLLKKKLVRVVKPGEKPEDEAE